MRFVEEDASGHIGTVRALRSRIYPDSQQLRARIERIDAVDRQILALLTEDGRRSYDDVGRRVSLSAPSVKRRVDRLKDSGVLQGFTAVLDERAFGASTEALVELFYAPGILLDEVARRLARHPEVVEAWSVTGEADAIARVRTRDNEDLERLIMALQREELVLRTRSQVIMSRLVTRAAAPSTASEGDTARG